MNTVIHEMYMQRCLQLARMGSGSVAPNPMVGSVLVYNDIIIGEGYHQNYGEPHAEVNCLNSVKQEHQHLIELSTLYVSLEPCAHFGKTPPCADLIIRHKIPKVIIGCRDPFAQVDGKGIEKLKAGGIEVIPGVLEQECQQLNKRFFTFHTKHRPYIVLKWAQSVNNKIANQDYNRVLISNTYTNRIVHKWRSEEMAIAVGTNTALHDDPELSTRLWPGKNPIRLVVDRGLSLPQSLKLFNESIPTVVFTFKQQTIEDVKTQLQNGVHYYEVREDVSLVQQMLNALYTMNIQSVLVEGGSFLLQSFIDEHLWDEARVITNQQLIIDNGLPAPTLHRHQLMSTETLLSDTIQTYQPIN